MADLNQKIYIKLIVKLSLWSAIKLRIAGVPKADVIQTRENELTIDVEGKDAKS